MADPSIPTFSAGTFSVVSSNTVFNLLNDSALAGSANGYQNEDPCFSVGSFNANFNNRILTSKAPVAGVNGNQS